MKYTDLIDKYKCDKCGHVFEGRLVKLIPASTSIKILTPIQPPMFVAKDGSIKRGGYNAEEGDSTLHCPSCEEPHLFGFNGV